MLRLGARIGLFAVLACLTTGSLASAAYFQVSSGLDDGLPGTLRWTIEQANSNGEYNYVSFTSGVTLANYHGAITVTAQVMIDGGRSTTINANGRDVFLFSGASGGSQVTGLAIYNANRAIQLATDNNLVTGCRFGINWGGGGSWNSYGIWVTGQNNIIGGVNAADRNWFVYNSYGVYNQGGRGTNIINNLFASDSYGIYAHTNSYNLVIQRNYFGTDNTGLVLSPYNGNTYAIRFDAVFSSLIGGNRLAGEGNIISASTTSPDVWLRGGASGNTLAGNIIGLNQNQTAVLTSSVGVQLDVAHSNAIGLDVAGGENIICGHSLRGIQIDAGAGNYALNNIIQNNIVGLSSSGTNYPNLVGVFVDNARGTTIGGWADPSLYQRNVISGNSWYEIRVTGNTHSILGNLIGTTLDGSAAASATTQQGLILSGSYNRVGQAGKGNVISGFTNSPGVGLDILAGSGNIVTSNSIGLNFAGTAALPNLIGLRVQSNVNDPLKPGVIGGNLANLRNVISGNTQYGVQVLGSTNVSVLGNYFGTDTAGTSVLGNGVALSLSQDNSVTVGGNAPNVRNLFCGSGTGLETLAGSNGNSVIANWFGALANGQKAATPFTKAIALGSSGNWIGLKNTGLGNLIAGAGTGVECNGNTSNGLYGNTICAFTTSGISLLGNANKSKAAPVITLATVPQILGTAGANDYVEVFVADRDSASAGGSLVYVGGTTANASGNWFMVPSGLSAGQYITGIATDAGNNSSRFTQNTVVLSGPPTATSTSTMTPTITPTATITPTRTPTPTYTVTPTLTASWTITTTPTITVTATISATRTESATITVTPSVTSTPSVSPTATISATKTMTSTLPPATAVPAGQSVKAYPNPGKGLINFLVQGTGPQTIVISIYNLTGERVTVLKLDPNGPATVAWDCAGVAPGIYVAKVKVNGSELEQLKVAVLR